MREGGYQRYVLIVEDTPRRGDLDEWTHMEAIDWNTARFTTNIPIRVDSEKLAASIGDGPLW